MPKPTKPQKDIYQLIDQYLTRRNIVMACIAIIILIISIWLWNYFSQTNIVVTPNVENYSIKITTSPQLFNREKSPETPEEIIVDQNMTNTFSTKLTPNQYYLVEVDKDGYSHYEFSFLAKAFFTKQLSPQLFQPLVQNYVKFPTYNPKKNQILYIDTPNNYLTALDLENDQTKIIENNSWFGVEKIVYSPNFTKAILKVKNDNITFSGGYYKTDIEDPTITHQTLPTSIFYKPEVANQVTTTWVFDLTTKKYYPLDQNIKSINWIDEKNIIYEYSNLTSAAFGDPNFTLNNTINTANFDGSNWQNIYDLKDTNLGFSEIIPSPTNPNQILLLPIPFETGTEIKTAIYLLNIDSQDISQITDTSIHGARWSPDGQKIIYAQLDASKNNLPTIYITDSTGSFQQNTNLNTLVSKTTWQDNQYLLCATPTNPDQPNNHASAIPANYHNQPDFPTLDTLYLVDTKNLTTKNTIANSYKHMTNIHSIFTDQNNIYWQDESNRIFVQPKNNQ